MEGKGDPSLEDPVGSLEDLLSTDGEEDRSLEGGVGLGDPVGSLEDPSSTDGEGDRSLEGGK